MKKIRMPICHPRRKEAKAKVALEAPVLKKLSKSASNSEKFDNLNSLCS